MGLDWIELDWIGLSSVRVPLSLGLVSWSGQDGDEDEAEDDGRGGEDEQEEEDKRKRKRGAALQTERGSKWMRRGGTREK